MQSLKENPKLTKVLVDNYELRGDRLLCDCLVAEPFETFEREVTYDEILTHIAPNGFVTVDLGNGDSKEVLAYNYLQDMGIAETCSVCAEIINKREDRSEISEMPDIFSTLGAILNPNQSLKKSA